MGIMAGHWQLVAHYDVHVEEAQHQVLLNYSDDGRIYCGPRGSFGRWISLLLQHVQK